MKNLNTETANFNKQKEQTQVAFPGKGRYYFEGHHFQLLPQKAFPLVAISSVKKVQESHR